MERIFFRLQNLTICAARERQNQWNKKRQKTISLVKTDLYKDTGVIRFHSAWFRANMAEHVQQSVEELLPELEQMERVGLFTNKEIR